jgi:hypothetical protein
MLACMAHDTWTSPYGTCASARFFFVLQCAQMQTRGILVCAQHTCGIATNHSTLNRSQQQHLESQTNAAYFVVCTLKIQLAVVHTRMGAGQPHLTSFIRGVTGSDSKRGLLGRGLGHRHHRHQHREEGSHRRTAGGLFTHGQRQSRACPEQNRDVSDLATGWYTMVAGSLLIASYSDRKSSIGFQGHSNTSSTMSRTNVRYMWTGS